MQTITARDITNEKKYKFNVSDEHISNCPKTGASFVLGVTKSGDAAVLQHSNNAAHDWVCFFYRADIISAVKEALERGDSYSQLTEFDIHNI